MASSGSRAGPRLRAVVVGVLLIAAGAAIATRGFAAPSAGCLGERATITGSGIINGTEGDDVIAWLKSLPGNQQPPPELSEQCKKPGKADYETCGEEIFQARCAVCHGPEAQGKEDTAPKGERPLWYQGLALWKGDVRHLDRLLHVTTVTNGRRFAFMPGFGEAPPQGVAVPPYPLTEEQIQAVVAYERSL